MLLRFPTRPRLNGINRALKNWFPRNAMLRVKIKMSVSPCWRYWNHIAERSVTLLTVTSIAWRVDWESSVCNQFYLHFSRKAFKDLAICCVCTLEDKLRNESGTVFFWKRAISKGQFTRYDFVACDKLTTGLRHDLGPFTRARHFHLQN